MRDTGQTCTRWLDALPKGTDTKTGKAVQGYKFCNWLFELAQSFDKLPAEKRLRQRTIL